MRRTITFRVAVIALFASTALAAPAVDEGFAVGGAREVIVSGTVFDSAAGTPIQAAQVTLSSDSSTDRATTGPDGAFSLTASSAEALGTLSIEVSAYGYQQKYIETLLRDAFRNRIDARVVADSVNIKSGKLKASLKCNASASVDTRAGSGSPVSIVCKDGLTGLELSVRKNRIAVLSAPPYSMRVENGRIELGDVSGSRVEIRVAAAMLPR